MRTYVPDDAEAVKGEHLDRLLAHAMEIASTDGQTPAELRFQYLSTELESIEYVRARGFRRYGGVFQMARDLAAPIPELEYLFTSPIWATGTTLTAFADSEVVGSVMLYEYLDEGARQGQRAGDTEAVFVRAPWRGRGIAKRLLSEGMHYLRQRGLEEARLQVLAANESVLRLYAALGYEVISESWLLSRAL